MLTKGPDGTRSIDCLEEVIEDWGSADRLDPLELSRGGDVYSLGLKEESDLFSIIYSKLSSARNLTGSQL